MERLDPVREFIKLPWQWIESCIMCYDVAYELDMLNIWLHLPGCTWKASLDFTMYLCAFHRKDIVEPWLRRDITFWFGNILGAASPHSFLVHKTADSCLVERSTRICHYILSGETDTTVVVNILTSFI